MTKQRRTTRRNAFRPTTPKDDVRLRAEARRRASFDEAWTLLNSLRKQAHFQAGVGVALSTVPLWRQEWFERLVTLPRRLQWFYVLAWLSVLFATIWLGRKQRRLLAQANLSGLVRLEYAHLAVTTVSQTLGILLMLRVTRLADIAANVILLHRLAIASAAYDASMFIVQAAVSGVIGNIVFAYLTRRLAYIRRIVEDEESRPRARRRMSSS